MPATNFKVSLRKLFRYLVVLSFSNLLACTTDYSPSTEKINIDPPESERERNEERGKEDPTALTVKNFRLLLANGLDETFSLLSATEQNWELKNNQSIASDGRSPCIWPSHLSHSDGLLYLTCSGSNEIQVFSEKTLERVKIFSTGVGSNPMGTAIYQNALYISLYTEDAILVLDKRPSAPTRFLKRIELGNLDLESDPGVATKAFPSHITVAEGKIFVSLNNLTQTFMGNRIAGGPGYLAVLDGDSMEVSGKIKLEGRNTVFSLSSADFPGLLFTSNAGDFDEWDEGYKGNGTLDVIDLTTMAVKTSTPVDGAPFELQLDKSGEAFIANAKEGTVLRWRFPELSTRPPIKALKNQCNSYQPTNVSYISSLQLVGENLFFTEFNSDCLLIYNIDEQEITSQIPVGDGPDVLLSY